MLAAADGGAGRLLAATIRSLTGDDGTTLSTSTPRSAIVDDRWLTVGSANLNSHSLFNDTEMNVVTDDAALARRLAFGCGPSTSGSTRPPLLRMLRSDVVDTRFRPIAAEQLRRARRGAAPTHRLLELPGVSRRSRRLLGPLVGLLDDG